MSGNSLGMFLVPWIAAEEVDLASEAVASPSCISSG